ncbi:hypothetical protein PF010_g3444 [Phytophthora fragariae]|uniref:Uncharacterized protein n=1 Tax=Phytophthora fragariae TaxID=53985 RepID=A0A6A4CSJ1_9STRA|nr:hypothetical protein PF010_g3444 [Phytophthora fragariae]KAE9294464.1 hypothetical protein PF001_g17767 [Phytophthora fragariae]
MWRCRAWTRTRTWWCHVSAERGLLLGLGLGGTRVGGGLACGSAYELACSSG